MNELIGGAWLAERYGLRLCYPLRVTSLVGTRRSTTVIDGVSREVHPAQMRPEATLKGHVTFHLKHELPNLELLARLFEALDPAELAAWVREEPTGSYARRAGFLFEWLTGRRLDVPDTEVGSLIDAVDSSLVVAATPGRHVTSRRWRVRDNLPGTRDFCPIVRKRQAADVPSPELTAALEQNIGVLLDELRHDFDQDVLMRAAVWLTLRESRASFEIEGEGNQTDRIQRFANVLGRRTGQGEVPLTNESLSQLQAEILGERTTLRQFGLRQSPVFVGESDRYQEIVHYIAPPAEQLAAMLQGLQVFLDRTAGQSPTMRCAAAAFGFVYIHPLADGNGRVHRFLINDILRRDGAVPPPYIVPVSALITGDVADRSAYDRILEEFSRPLMELLAGSYDFGARQEYPDGIWSNLRFGGEQLAAPAWRFPDLTKHVAYLANVIERTVREHMREESRYLRSHSLARRALKELVEMPDAQADRIIRSVETNRGRLTNLLAREIPALTRDGLWEQMVAVVREAFADDPAAHTAEAKPAPDEGQAG
jgi:hypothetical protein